jgi:hypothetical protein
MQKNPRQVSSEIIPNASSICYLDRRQAGGLAKAPRGRQARCVISPGFMFDQSDEAKDKSNPRSPSRTIIIDGGGLDQDLELSGSATVYQNAPVLLALRWILDINWRCNYVWDFHVSAFVRPTICITRTIISLRQVDVSY